MQRKIGAIHFGSVVLALGVALCAAGCGMVTTNATGPASGSTGTNSPASGTKTVPSSRDTPAKGTLAGQVMARSSCGARNPVSPCPLVPVDNAALSIETASGVAVVTVTSDRQGRFSVSVSPGYYMVRPVARSGAANVKGAPVAVDVVSGRTVSVQIIVSSGLQRM